MTHKPYRVLLYYNYTPLEQPADVVAWQKELCTKLGLLGRILVGAEGINGTCAGSVEATDAYQAAMLADPRFATTQFKVDEADFVPFHKLKVKLRDEIVTLGIRGADPANAGQHLSPAEWHAMAQQDDVVILDGRNLYEAQVGKFKNAITPDISFFREFPQWVKEHKSELQNKKVLMYCTGGIRCERASALLKEEGIQDVYQLDGGIVNYGKQIPDGLWEGSLYVFDERVAVQINDDAHHQPIAKCEFCAGPVMRPYNCGNAECNKYILQCNNCLELSNGCCSEACAQKHRTVVKPWRVVVPIM